MDPVDELARKKFGIAAQCARIYHAIRIEQIAQSRSVTSIHRVSVINAQLVQVLLDEKFF